MPITQTHFNPKGVVDNRDGRGGGDRMILVLGISEQSISVYPIGLWSISIYLPEEGDKTGIRTNL